MPRHILIRSEQGKKTDLVPEARIAQEEVLQEAIKMHPQLIPAADFGLGDLLVVGREASAGNGYADLVCIDPSGQIAIIEMKRGPENPDSRRVVAQILEYGAHFWQMDAGEFEERALAYFRSDRCSEPSLKQVRSLQEAVSIHMGLPVDDECNGQPSTDGDLLSAIEENLRQGRFVYLIVSSQVGASLRRVMHYLNTTTSFLVGAIEVDYFAQDGRELFIPRSIIQTAGVRSAGRSSARTTREQFLEDVVPTSRRFFEDLFDQLEALGITVEWGTKGCAYKVHNGTRMVSLLWCFPQTVHWLKGKGRDEIEVATAGPDDDRTQAALDAWRTSLEGFGGWTQKKGYLAMQLGPDVPDGLLNAIVSAAGDAVRALDG